MELPYAEDVKHYWQTSQSSPDVWVERARKVIVELGGEILSDAYGSANGRAAFMLTFRIDEQNYKVIWPVLPTYSGKESSAKRQAATMLYHDVKAKAMTASVLGAEVAFFSYMLLKDGRSAGELSRPELSDAFPKLLE